MTAAELLEVVRGWVPIAVTILAAIWTWFKLAGASQFAPATALRELAEADRAVAARLAVVEERLRHLPTDAEMAAITTSLDHFREEQRAIRAGIARIEDYLLRDRRP